MSFWITAIVALLVAGGWVLWRVGPILFGRVREGDTADKRIARWNSFIVPLLRKMTDGLVVAHAQSFESRADGRTHTLATWAMVPSVLPDVDFVALARPDGDRERPEVVAVAEATALRALLGEKAQQQVMWGHVTWVQVWPESIDLDAVVAKLTPVEVFRATHGFAVGSDEPPPNADGA